MYNREKILADQYKIMQGLSENKEERMRFLENFMELVEEETEKYLEHDQMLDREGRKI